MDYQWKKNVLMQDGLLIKNVRSEETPNNNHTKSTKTILNHPEKYHIQQAIKLGQYNVGREGKILTLPTYMAFLLTDY